MDDGLPFADTPLVLDVSRSVARGARVPTGIDRVELAYISAMQAHPSPVFGLCRTRLGAILVGREGLRDLDRALGAPDGTGDIDTLSRLTRKDDPPRGRLETVLRARAVARAPHRWIGRSLRRHVPAGGAYLNVGHANLTGPWFRAVSEAVSGGSTLLLHDVIPLQRPDLCRADRVEAFRTGLEAVLPHVRRLIWTNAETRDQALPLIPQFQGTHHIAPLGVRLPQPGGRWPEGLSKERSLFAALGTLEPRKNLRLLLQVWERLEADPDQPLPQLALIGARGWESGEVLEKLDAMRARSGSIVELGPLCDADVDMVLSHAKALLFPSLLEGFGLPPLEAAQLGVPVLCNALPQLTDRLGGRATVLPEGDVEAWSAAVRQLDASPPRRCAPLEPPRWQAHFDRVLGPAGAAAE